MPGAADIRGWSCGVVIIGRNEGDRLKVCITSALASCRVMVYVDSGSTDGSAAWARSQGVDVVDLDMSSSFTAARARNAGFARLVEVYPEVQFVQFVDGDCELRAGWLNQAAEFLGTNSGVAAVCGRLRERFPKASIFNEQCDREWNTPAGETRACGGIAMFRRKAFEQVQGFRTDLIAGEEPELCVRLRAAGWKIWRADLEMALHDAAITRWSQWWRRTQRTGYAYAEGAHLHGGPPERHWVAEHRRSLAWGLGLPALAVGGATVLHPLFLATTLLYPLQMLRLAVRSKRDFGKTELQQAALTVLGKLPEAIGALRYGLTRVRRRPASLIEYK